MPEITSSRYVVHAGWDHVPHLDEKTKREIYESTPPYLRDARAKGIPSLGSGAIYPIQFDDISVKPFAIPPFWRRAYGLDVGWNRTAAIWGAQDPSDGTIYLYAEYYRAHEQPPIHAAGIKARGAWMKGAIDPAAHGRGQLSGEQLMVAYKQLDLNLVPANNEVHAALDDMWVQLSVGRMKVFSTLSSFRGEYEEYHRDDKGNIVKGKDHLMDAWRYLVRTWDRVASIQPPKLRGSAESGGGIADRRAGY